MSLPVALSLIALIVAVFAVMTAFAMYTRLRMLERAVLNPRTALLADEARTAPVAVQPKAGQRASLVLLLDPGCSTCSTAVDVLTEFEPSDVRLVAVLPVESALDVYSGPAALEQTADPDVWSALYEGYAPCIYVVEPGGEIRQRRFLYEDTDIRALFDAVVSAPRTLREFPCGLT